VIVFPNCKINLGLHVLEKRPDGFHNIETIFYPLPFYEALEAVKAPDGVTSFHSSGLPVPLDGKPNICLQAYEILKKEYKIPAVKFHLHKKIPSGAGLGGGSADGAFTLCLLNKIFSLDLSKKKLQTMAASLGSDCAFFLENKPMHARGRGEILTPVAVNLNGYSLVLVIPPIHACTTEAYANIRPEKPAIPLKEILKKPIEQWKETLTNDFERAVFLKYPEIKKIKALLYQEGAMYASMSGSGSAVFALFKESPPPGLKRLFNNCFFRVFDFGNLHSKGAGLKRQGRVFL